MVNQAQSNDYGQSLLVTTAILFSTIVGCGGKTSSQLPLPGLAGIPAGELLGGAGGGLEPIGNGGTIAPWDGGSGGNSPANSTTSIMGSGGSIGLAQGGSSADAGGARGGQASTVASGGASRFGGAGTFGGASSPYATSPMPISGAAGVNGLTCGANETRGAEGACSCNPGFARATPAAVCAPMSPGSACSASMPCPSDKYSFCHDVAQDTGYCTTSGCTSSNDCTYGYACDATGPISYCRRPPRGADLSCKSDADCVGTEATYCDSYVFNKCLVKGCRLVPDDCFPGTECCDLGEYVPNLLLCLPAGTCTT